MNVSHFGEDRSYQTHLSVHTGGKNHVLVSPPHTGRSVYTVSFCLHPTQVKSKHFLRCYFQHNVKKPVFHQNSNTSPGAVICMKLYLSFPFCTLYSALSPKYQIVRQRTCSRSGKCQPVVAACLCSVTEIELSLSTASE